MNISRFAPIGVIDSGIGGISMLKELRKKYIGENYIYLADNQYMPYGNKSSKFLCSRVLELVDYLVSSYNVKLVILACNTASVCCLNYLNKQSPVRVLGLDIGYLTNVDHKVLCTLATSRKYRQLNTYNCGNLARVIEDNFFDKGLIKRKIAQILHKANIVEDNIVLGCTHYELVDKIFNEIEPNKQYILPCKDFVQDLSIDRPNISNKEGDVLMLATLATKSYIDKLWRIFKS